MVKNTSDLMAMKVAELKQICKEGGIRHYNGKNCFKKIELVEAILRAEENVEGYKAFHGTMRITPVASSGAAPVRMMTPATNVLIAKNYRYGFAAIR